MAENVNVEFDDQTLQLVEVHATVELNEIVVHAEPVEVQIVEVFVDLNSAQIAIDAAAAAQQALAEIQSIYSSGIISRGTITRVDNVFTFSIGFIWKILTIVYQNTVAVVLTVPAATAGFYRISAAVLTNSNTIVLVNGVEDESEAQFPELPPGTILLTYWTVFGEVISEPTEPIVGALYVEKQETVQKIVNSSGQISIDLDTQETNFILTNNGLEIIEGTTPTNQYMSLWARHGKILTFFNKTDNPILFKHSLEPYNFRCPNNENYIAQPGEYTEFKEVKDDGTVFYRFVNTSRIDYGSSSAIPVTYSELVNKVNNGQLIEGCHYKITNFKTVHKILGTTTNNIGAVEPLIVFALSNNKISEKAISLNFPSDIISYSLLDNTIMHPSSGSFGVITYRKDTINNLSTYYDFRNVVFRRWAINPAPGLYFAYSVFSGINSYVEKKTFGVNCKDINIESNSFNAVIGDNCFAISIEQNVGTAGAGITIENNCHGINIDKDSCQVTTVGSGYVGGIYIGADSRYITIGSRSYNIAIGSDCYAIVLGMQNSDINVPSGSMRRRIEKGFSNFQCDVDITGLDTINVYSTTVSAIDAILYGTAAYCGILKVYSDNEEEDIEVLSALLTSVSFFDIRIIPQNGLKLNFIDKSNATNADKNLNLNGVNVTIDGSKGESIEFFKLMLDTTGGQTGDFFIKSKNNNSSSAQNLEQTLELGDRGYRQDLGTGLTPFLISDRTKVVDNTYGDDHILMASMFRLNDELVIKNSYGIPIKIYGTTDLDTGNFPIINGNAIDETTFIEIPAACKAFLKKYFDEDFMGEFWMMTFQFENVPSSGPSSTDFLPEGSTNKYFTEARALAAVPTATDSTQGKTKLYSSLNYTNTDGAVRQKEVVERFNQIGSTLAGYDLLLFNNNLRQSTDRTLVYLFDHFTGTGLDNGYAQNISGGGNTSVGENRTGAKGVSVVHTGTSSATGQGALIIGSTNNPPIIIGQGRFYFRTRVQVPVLSDASQSFYAQEGFLCNSFRFNPSGSMMFMYDQSGAFAGGANPGSPNWKCVTNNGTSRTFSITSIPVIAGTWYELLIIVNAAGTQVDFYIDGNLQFSHTTNIPTTPCFINHSIVKTVGTTQRETIRDWFQFQYT